VPLEEGRDLHVEVRPTQLEQTTLADVFLSDTIAESLRFFVDCIQNFDALRQPIRYLLSGKPGTGKTKIIRAVANETKGKATFILTNGSDERLDSVFTFAEIFSPAVVCIDDVDLLIGNRELGEREKSLGKFLQRLDGFIDSSVFVLATTNDKLFVDMAASRPGRFDMVLDINPIEAKHYMSLIRSRTDSEATIALFDEHVLEVLEARKVTGAFLTTLLKHLELTTKMGKRSVDTSHVLRLIDRMNTSFYKNPEAIEDKIGFIN
jgi:AAA+ superfamily predicted ATPase